MADQKANIIIAATSVLFTLSVGYLGSSTVLWGLIALCAFSLVSLIFAVLSVTPLFRPAGEADLRNPRFNPLFFGHFADLSLEHYEREMSTILQSDENIYEAMVREIYQLGRVLKTRKYRYLRISYQVFLAGILASAVLIALQLLFQKLA